MIHAEIGIIPVLALVDYILTIQGSKEASRVYRLHFVTEAYELNPRLRKSVEAQQWFNPRHIFGVCVFTIVFIVADYVVPHEWPIEFGIGIAIGIWGTVIGKHISGLLLFRFLNRTPSEVSGQVHLSNRLAQKISQFEYFGFAPVPVAIAVFAANPYTSGIAVGILALVFIHASWSKTE